MSVELVQFMSQLLNLDMFIQMFTHVTFAENKRSWQWEDASFFAEFIYVLCLPWCCQLLLQCSLVRVSTCSVCLGFCAIVDCADDYRSRPVWYSLCASFIYSRCSSFFCLGFNPVFLLLVCLVFVPCLYTAQRNLVLNKKNYYAFLRLSPKSFISAWHYISGILQLTKFVRVHTPWHLQRMLCSNLIAGQYATGQYIVIHTSLHHVKKPGALFNLHCRIFALQRDSNLKAMFSL